MSIESFIKRANDLASKTNPFFFVIDFEQITIDLHSRGGKKSKCFFLTLVDAKILNITLVEKKFDITPKTKIKDRNKTGFEQVQNT